MTWSASWMPLSRLTSRRCDATAACAGWAGELEARAVGDATVAPASPPADAPPAQPVMMTASMAVVTSRDPRTASTLIRHRRQEDLDAVYGTRSDADGGPRRLRRQRERQRRDPGASGGAGDVARPVDGAADVTVPVGASARAAGSTPAGWCAEQRPSPAVPVARAARNGEVARQELALRLSGGAEA